MKIQLSKISQYFQENHGLSLTDQELEMINENVLTANQDRIIQIEEKHFNDLKSSCINSVWHALDKYHHSGMGTDEIKTIVGNVIQNRAELPDVTETARLFILD
jgi:hypothetical protein